MTLATTPPIIEYVENGVTLDHAVPFQFVAAGDLVVSRIDPATAIETLLTIGTDYTVSGGAGLNGDVHKTAAGTVGHILRIKRFTPREQPADYTPGDAFPAESHEDALDRVTSMVQEQDVAIDDTTRRAMLVPLDETIGLLPAKEDRVGKFLAFDADGEPTPSQGTGADEGLREDLVAGTGGGLVGLVRNAAGAVARSLIDWWRSLAAISPEDFGAVGDGVADDFTAFVNMWAAVNAAGGGHVRFGRGKTYLLDRHVGDGVVPELTTSDNGGMMISGCKGLTIDLNGATITTKGGWDRDVPTKAGLSGLRLDDCNFVSIRNGEIYGRADTITNTSGASVPVSYGIELRSCCEVDVDGIYAHHMIADSFRMRESSTVYGSQDEKSSTPAIVADLTTAPGSAIATMASTAGLRAGMGIFGPNSPPTDPFQGDGYYIVSVDSGVQITMSKVANAASAPGANSVQFGWRRACRRVRFRNCRGSFNARMGMSVIQARGAIVDNCEFSYNGFNDELGTAATFTGGGGPNCGVDVEPNNTPTINAIMDVLTGDVAFRRCRIFGNAAATLLANKFLSSMYWLENITVDHCTIECNDGTVGGQDGFILDCNGALLVNSTLRLRDRVGYFGYSITGGAPDQRMSSCIVYGRTTSANGVFMSRAMLGGRTVIEGNIFTAQQAAPVAGPWIFRFENNFADVLGNTFVLPKEAYVDATGTDIMRAVRMDVRQYGGNRYQTDLLAGAGSGGTAHYGVMYGAASVGRDERFKGSAPGWADTIRPGDNVTNLAFTWDTNFRFGSNLRMNRLVGHNWPNLAAAAQQSTPVTVVGAALGDKVDVSMSIALAGTALRGEVTAADTVTVYQANHTAGAVDLGAGDIYATVTRRAP